jgi:ribosomal protein RSM22 (predicted rRNA methylase)
MRFIQTSRYGLELSRRLFEGRAVDSEDLLDEGEEEPTGNMSFERKLTNDQGKVCTLPLHQTKANIQTSLAISSFYLSTLPTQSSRQVHLRQLLASSPDYIILVDRSSRDGWTAISEARSYLLSLSDSTSGPSAGDLHLIAPCPHKLECPLAGGRDRCSFSQKLQRPDFTRKTKHTNRGEEDVNYTYLVLGRGNRPTSSGASTQAGRLGGVGKEALEKEAEKREGKSELREVEGGGGEFEMVSLAESTSGQGLGSATKDDKTEEEVDGELRTEAYTWPRVVAPPMKRAGHVILDTCFPDGSSSHIPVDLAADE